MMWGWLLQHWGPQRQSGATRAKHQPATKRRHKSPVARDWQLLTRTSWKDAKTALDQIDKGKATGSRAALWLRARLQCHLFQLGCFVQRHAGKVLFVGLLVLSTFCVGLKSAHVQTDVQKLWVEEGGRLEKELAYIQKAAGTGSGSSNQVIIHTPTHEGVNVLHPESMLAHLNAVLAATRIHVDAFDTVWKLKDLCVSPSYPAFEDGMLEQMFELLMPCAIITPLDCFWEGSKILGPDFPVIIPELSYGLQWTNFNPQELLHFLKLHFTFPAEMIEDFMNRAGISNAYQKKPCLNPHDPLCPTTAPNKETKALPDIGTHVTGGCYGIAANYMHWPEQLIIGGSKKNKTGHIVKAEAVQSVIQVMGEKEMYEFWRDNYKVHNIDWTQEKAKYILEKWQRKFTDEMLAYVQNPNISKSYQVNAFSSTSLTDILKEFSEVSITQVVLGYVFMLIYACVSLLRWTDTVHSQSGIGIAGVLLVAISVAAGLGFCALMGIMFNAATTQIVPFLALGLGVDDMFLLAHTYAKNVETEIPCEEETGECLKQTGVSILLTSISNVCAFFAAAIIPIPALRAFALQVAILIIFNLGSMLLIFPAIVSLDLRRRDAKRVDFFCCFLGSSPVRAVGSVIELENKSKMLPKHAPSSNKRHTVTHAPASEGLQAVTVLAPSQECWPGSTSASQSVESLANSASTRELVPERKISLHERYVSVCARTQQECYLWSLTWFAREHYAPFLQRTPTKIFTVLFFIILLIFGIWGMMKVTDGLDLTDIVPRNTNEFQFLHNENKYFGFYNIFAVTQGNFDYPNNQRLLYEYHDAFMRVENIVKDDDGALPEFWLGMFRDWLTGLQNAFDRDWQNGCINQERWFRNASSDGILAYKLLVQTGHVDNPVDKQLVAQVRLVDSNGIINTKAFYNYLTAWVTNDPLVYSTSLANFKPQPKFWIHDAKDYELKIAKAQPLTYTLMPFYLNNLHTTQDILETIQAVRAICEKYEDKGLPNFPTGIPFTYWEQYLHLRFHLALALGCVLGAMFVVITIILLNPWTAFLVIMVLVMIFIELFGFMGIIGIRLNAIPAVILIVAVGIGVEFTVHICMGFVTSIGSCNRRMEMSLVHMMPPVVHGGLSTLMGITMLAFSEFDFIVRYIFYMLCALVILGLLNGLVLLPVLLSLVGPKAEVIPNDDPDRIATPTPEPSPPKERSRNRKQGFHRRVYPQINSEISLSTITEEPPSWQSSHEIVVQPEVVVETTTSFPNHEAHSSTTSSHGTSSTTHSEKSSNSTSTTHSHVHGVTTKVTATAKVKVEVHTPMPSSLDKEHCYKYKRRKESTSRLAEVDLDSSDSSSSS